MTLETARNLLGKSVRGELTEKKSVKHFSFKDGSFVRAFVKTMKKMQDNSDVRIEKSITDSLFPILLCNSARQGDVALIESILSDKNVNVDVTDYDGRTALMHSVIHNRLECVKYLIDICKCDVNVVDTKHHMTALEYAEKKSDTEIMEILLEAHAKKAKDL